MKSVVVFEWHVVVALLGSEEPELPTERSLGPHHIELATSRAQLSHHLLDVHRGERWLGRGSCARRRRRRRGRWRSGGATTARGDPRLVEQLVELLLLEDALGAHAERRKLSTDVLGGGALAERGRREPARDRSHAPSARNPQRESLERREQQKQVPQHLQTASTCT